MFSVLLSVYHKENPEFLQCSIDSICNQTLNPDEIVLVKDGPLTDSLERVIQESCKKYPNKIIIVPLKKNNGLGIALNEGLKHCTHEIVARMDTDDIAKPERFEKELAILEKYHNIDVVGSWVDEFIDSPKNIIATRKVPEAQKQIRQYSKFRTPVNHPSVVFRKKAVIAAGGYQDIKLYEDYDLWVRMMKNGALFYNIQESLLLFRITENTYKRRGGLKYATTEFNFIKKLHSTHYLSTFEFIVSILFHTIIRLIPNKLRAFAYKYLLR